MPDLKRVLNAIDRKTLLHLSHLAGLKGASVLNKKELVNRLARKRSISWQDVLGQLDKHTLNKICWALGMDAAASSKQVLVWRILGESVGPGQAADHLSEASNATNQEGIRNAIQGDQIGKPLSEAENINFKTKGALRIYDSVYGHLVFSQQSTSKSAIRILLQKGQSPILNLNTVCPYYTMFPLDFPFRHLRKAKNNNWVLDPFCGRGTTLFAARLLGLGCVGIDSNPIAAAIAAAKLVYTTPDAVVKKAESILEEAYSPSSIPEGEFWDLCYHPETLKEICILRDRLMKSCETAEEVILRALLLGILHGPRQRGLPTYLSNQMPRTYATKPNAAVHYWKRTQNMEPPRIDVLDAVKRRAEYSLSTIPPASKGAVFFGDAQSTDRVVPTTYKFHWVVTSPPYFGMRTYRPDQWLRNWFLGGAETVDYSQKGQLSHSADKFTKGLSDVWKTVAKRCSPGARLIIRFGYLPSVPVDPREVLRTSLKLADSGWRIRRWVDAGSANNGNRQSDQFGRVKNAATSEVDVYAKLEA